MKPQTAYVLDQLREAGPVGVHSNTFRRDGEHYVADPSKRICELRDAGYEVAISRERLHGEAYGARYVLTGEPRSVEVGRGPEPRGRGEAHQLPNTSVDPGGPPASAGSESVAAAGVRSPARSGGGPAPTLLIVVDLTDEDAARMGYEWIDADEPVAA